MKHPIVECALRTLVEDGGGRMHVDPARAAALEEALRMYFGRPDLSDVVRELVVFALYVGEGLGAREAARTLLEVAACATGALEAQAAARNEGLRTARRRAASFIGGDRGCRAPMREAKAPAGSVSVAEVLSGLTRRRP